MKAIVIEPYERPYGNPIAVSMGEQVLPDFDKSTDIKGWVWCTAKDGRSGWTPEQWLIPSNGKWHLTREFNAIELTIVLGEVLDIVREESGFFLARREDGESGWVPCANVSVDNQT
jgi:hypothetical protein